MLAKCIRHHFADEPNLTKSNEIGQLRKVCGQKAPSYLRTKSVSKTSRHAAGASRFFARLPFPQPKYLAISTV